MQNSDEWIEISKEEFEKNTYKPKNDSELERFRAMMCNENYKTSQIYNSSKIGFKYYKKKTN